MAASESDRLWESVKTTLRAYRFRLDRVDRVAGVITTAPLGSQHFFEFWRHDVDTFADWVDATINPVRRRVTVTVVEGESDSGGEGTPRINVEVRKERLSAPDRQFNSPGAAYEFFGNRLPSTAGKPHVDPADERWIDRGRDAAMEERITGEILARAERAPRSP